MRGHTHDQMSLLCHISLESRVPASHPLRRIKAQADRALVRIEKTLAAMYSNRGRNSVPPERLLKARLLRSRNCSCCAQIQRYAIGRALRP